MNILTRRRIAIILIMIGLLALGIGLYIIVSLFLPQKTTTEPNLPKPGTDMTVTAKPKAEPKVIALPDVVINTSSQAAIKSSSDVRDAINRASSVVSRMGSGSNQDGFLGYQDAILDATDAFKTYLLKLQSDMKAAHPANGSVYGVTTRVVSADVISGEQGADKIVLKVQTQKAEDMGDRAEPTSITYEEVTVTLLRQSDGSYLVDRVESVPMIR